MKLDLIKPKRIFLGSLLTSVIFLSPLSSLALTVQEVPNPRQHYGGWVTDMAGILSNQTESEINHMISGLEAKNGTEIAVVTVPETSPANSPKQFTTQLFNHWKIGKKGKDNGVLFLISVGDRRVEIETGYGVEAILPDAKVGNIIDTQIIPRFKKGDFEAGTLAGTKALVVILKSPRSLSANKVTSPNQVETPYRLDTPPEESTADDFNLWVRFALGGLFVLLIGTAVYLGRTRKITLEPEGRTRRKEGNYIFLCANCQEPMEQVDEATVKSYLSQPEKVAQTLGSVKFEGWKCPHCKPQLTDQGFHLVALESYSPQFKKCPHCDELTVTSTEKIVELATIYSSGKRLITDNCHSCDYQQQTEEIIPPLPLPPPPPPPPRSSTSSSSWGGYSGGGSSDGGGGSFGGGDSGGGGAGGSW